MNKNTCRYWCGILNDKCSENIVWRKEHSNARVCLGYSLDKCSKYKQYTEKELKRIEEDSELAIRAKIEMLKTGLSDCCGVKINEEHVIRKGQYTNHGPR
jgi:hypothetical protein